MSRKVISLSLSQELLAQFVNLAKIQHKSQSELFRELIIARSRVDKTDTDNKLADSIVRLVGNENVQTIVVGLAIIRSDNKILIVSRKNKDERVSLLGWAFPGSRLFTLSMHEELKSELHARLGVGVGPLTIISARVIPETVRHEQQVIAVYFEADLKSQDILLDPTHYTEYRWVSPLEVFTYFSTSTSDEISHYLNALNTSPQ